MILEIKQLIAEGVFNNGNMSQGSISNESQLVLFKARNEEHSAFLRLYYNTRDYYGKDHHFDLYISILRRKSNLGKGEILLFRCPYCFRPCRKLLKVNYCINFKCRKCYSTLLYPTQDSSKMWKANSQFFNIKRKLEELYEMRFTNSYNGKKTKRAKRIEYLESKLNYYDHLRFAPETIPLRLRKMLFH